jgi:hypothetical protein
MFRTRYGDLLHEACIPDWWLALNVDRVVFRFREDERARLIWRNLGWGKMWTDSFGLNDDGGIVFSKHAVAVVSLSRDESHPAVRFHKPYGLVPLIIWSLLDHGFFRSRSGNGLVNDLTLVFRQLGAKPRDEWQKEIGF